MSVTVKSVADPGFPRRGGGQLPRWGHKPFFNQFFPENCIKKKEFGPRAGSGARPSRPPPLDPPLKIPDIIMKRKKTTC